MGVRPDPILNPPRGSSNDYDRARLWGFHVALKYIAHFAHDPGEYEDSLETLREQIRIAATPVDNNFSKELRGTTVSTALAVFEACVDFVRVINSTADTEPPPRLSGGPITDPLVLEGLELQEDVRERTKALRKITADDLKIRVR